MRKALIDQGGRIVQVVDAEKEFPVHTDLKWIECADDVSPETHVREDGRFTSRVTTQSPRATSIVDQILADQEGLAKLEAALATIRGR